MPCVDQLTHLHGSCDVASEHRSHPYSSVSPHRPLISTRCIAPQQLTYAYGSHPWRSAVLLPWLTLHISWWSLVHDSGQVSKFLGNDHGYHLLSYVHSGAPLTTCWWYLFSTRPRSTGCALTRTMGYETSRWTLQSGILRSSCAMHWRYTSFDDCSWTDLMEHLC